MELSSHWGPLVATSKQEAKYISFEEKIAFYPRFLFSEKLTGNQIFKNINSEIILFFIQIHFSFLKNPELQVSLNVNSHL